MNIKASRLYELEFEDEAECENLFVPIKPGTYETKADGLKDKGAVVTFVAE